MIFRSQKQLIKELKEEIRRLTDENESLWQMLDEITASDIQNYANLIEDMVKQKQLDALMASTKKAKA